MTLKNQLKLKFDAKAMKKGKGMLLYHKEYKKYMSIEDESCYVVDDYNIDKVVIVAKDLCLDWYNVSKNAKVYDNAWVYDRAQLVSGKIRENALMYDNAYVLSPSADIYGNAKVYGNTHILALNLKGEKTKTEIKIFGQADVSGLIFSSAGTNYLTVSGNNKLKIYGNAKVSGNVELDGEITICDNAKLQVGQGYAWFWGKCMFYGNAKLTGDIFIAADIIAHNEIRGADVKMLMKYEGEK